jgi:hypothetical protein
MTSLREFTFDITLSLSFDILGLKYISATVKKDCSIIHPRFKINSDKFFVTESKYLLNSFFSMFFKHYPELKVEYSDITFSLNNDERGGTPFSESLEEIKDTETCEEVFNKICCKYKRSIVVSYV